ncbi:MAG: SCO family protein [Mariprofundaceae bacterium]|nr:SCO family protein [Mariprofundaceae bacterium]
MTPLPLFAAFAGSRSSRLGFGMVLFLLFAWPGGAQANYGNIPESTHIDPELVRIDEDKYLGARISGDYALRDAGGESFTLGGLLGRPLLLVLSYYSCDGACPAINRNLRDTLAGVKRWERGRDYRVLTLSFDPHDTPESLRMFMQHAGFGTHSSEGWRLALLNDPADIGRLTESLGYKFFWSPRDAMFLHPNVYILLSPEGRVMRYLYGASISSTDMELSITKAYGNEISPANAVNFLLAACYSYNYRDGKYSINYPLFIALGSLLLGISMITGGVLVMKKRKRRETI